MLLVNGLNVAFKKIPASDLNVEYESMSDISFQTTEKVELPHMSCIVFKWNPW